MKQAARGAVGGLAGGLALSAVMAMSRRLGLYPTLAERSEAWLDQTFGAGRRAGAGGVAVLEQANHLAAGVAFGAGLAVLRRRLAPRWPMAAGVLYGLGMYGVNIGVIAPLLGLTRGEWNERPGVRLQRAGMHLLYGAVTAAVSEALRGRPAAAFPPAWRQRSPNSKPSPRW